MPLPIRLRPATDVDLETLVRFGAAMALETEHRRLDRTRLREGILNLLSDPRRGFFRVAETVRHESSHVVGQLMVTFEWSDWRNGNFWWLQSVYVHPDQRQQQIFRKLYEYVQSQAYLNQEPICGYRLYVEENNHQAHQAYVNLGFQNTAYHMYEKEFSWTSPSFP